MGKAIYHAQSSAKKFGGKTEDYLDLHEFMDSSREVFGDYRHRTLTHHPWFMGIAVRIYGHLRINSDQREYSVLEVLEQHVIEDIGFIPAGSDYLEAVEPASWMLDGSGDPPSSKRKMIINPVPSSKTSNTSRPAFSEGSRRLDGKAHHEDFSDSERSQFAPRNRDLRDIDID